MANGAEDLAESPLDLISDCRALFYLSCNSDSEPTLITCRWNDEQEKVLGVHLLPFCLAPVNIGTSSEPSFRPERE